MSSANPSATRSAVARSAARVVDLGRNPFEARAFFNVLLTVGAWLVALLGAVPLFSVIYMLVVKGGARLAPELFTELPPAGFETGAASAMRFRAPS
jgi:phosphate transport system permease protein